MHGDDIMRNVLIAIGLLASTSASAADTMRFVRAANFIVSGKTESSGPPHGSKPNLSECSVLAPANIYTGQPTIKFKEVIRSTLWIDIKSVGPVNVQVLVSTFTDTSGNTHTVSSTTKYDVATILSLWEAWSVVFNEFCPPTKKSLF